MAEFEILVYQISVKDLEKLLEKFPVFASAELSEDARNQGAYENKGTGTGWYFTRNKAENGWVIYVGFCGGLIAYSPSNPDTGLRVGMHYEYDENSEVLKTLHEAKRKGYVWDPKIKTKKLVKGKAPVVTIGKIDYIWLNKEECEAKETNMMELVSLKLITKAVPFSQSDWNNNYDEAQALRKQSEFVALFNCTAEERAKIVPVVISSRDNFMSVTPVSKTIEKKDAGKVQTVSQAVCVATAGEGK